MGLIDFSIFNLQYTRLGSFDINFINERCLANDIDDVKYFLRRSFEYIDSMTRKLILEFDPEN